MTSIAHVAQLIQIQGYVANAINNFALNKATAKELNNTLLMLNNKIVAHVLSDEFKDLIEFENVDEAIKEAMANNNIKTGRKDLQSVSSAVVATGNGAQTIKPERL